jgi:hypothetical protein
VFLVAGHKQRNSFKNKRYVWRKKETFKLKHKWGQHKINSSVHTKFRNDSKTGCRKDNYISISEIKLRTQAVKYCTSQESRNVVINMARYMPGTDRNSRWVCNILHILFCDKQALSSLAMKLLQTPQGSLAKGPYSFVIIKYVIYSVIMQIKRL